MYSDYKASRIQIKFISLLQLVIQHFNGGVIILLIVITARQHSWRLRWKAGLPAIYRIIPRAPLGLM